MFLSTLRMMKPQVNGHVIKTKIPLPKQRFEFTPRADAMTIPFAQVIKDRHKYLSPSLATFTAYADPIAFPTGKFQYLWDQTGKRYLDLLAQNLTISIGHNHPRVIDTVKNQQELVTHTTTMYYHESQGRLAKKLVETMPKGHDWVVHFVCTGSEAVDLALLAARVHTGNFDVIGIRGAYHGLQNSAMGLVGLHTCRQNTPTGFGIQLALQPDTYRGIFKAKQGDKEAERAAGKEYAQDVRNMINYSTPGNIAAFIAEPLQGFGGIYMLPDGYLKDAFKYTRDAGGVCIADEVQTGFGRMGDHYWGFGCHDVVPDIVTLAKGLGNGHPIAATIMKREIAESMSNKLYFNTYGGNPTCCEVGSTVMDVIEEEGIQANAKKMSELFLVGLKELEAKHELIGEVRGHGLMLGVDIVKNGETKEPARRIAVECFEMCRDMGVIFGKSGLEGNVIRIMAVMCLNEDDVKFALDVLDYCIGKMEEKYL